MHFFYIKFLGIFLKHETKTFSFCLTDFELRWLRDFDIFDLQIGSWFSRFLKFVSHILFKTSCRAHVLDWIIVGG